MAKDPLPLPSQAYLKECLTYCHLSGSLYWRERPLAHFCDERAHRLWNARHKHKPAGGLAQNGYLRLSIGGQPVLAHRIAYKIVTGEEPGIIDHRNQSRRDNRIFNLRPASRSENLANRGPIAKNKSGMKGVCRDGRRFAARIGCLGKRYSLGTYETPEAARAAYADAAARLFGEFASS